MGSVDKSILLVGLGQIGSRYLQGVALSGLQIIVDIVEPSRESFLNGMKSFFSISRGNSGKFQRGL